MTHYYDHGTGHGSHACDCWLIDDHDWQANELACNHLMVSDR